MHSIVTLDLAIQRVDHATRAAELRTARGPVRPQAARHTGLATRIALMLGIPQATGTSLQTQVCC